MPVCRYAGMPVCRYAGFAGVHALYKDVDSYNRY